MLPICSRCQECSSDSRSLSSTELAILTTGSHQQVLQTALLQRKEGEGFEIHSCEHACSKTPVRGSESSDLKAEELPALGRNFHPEVALGRHKRRPVQGCPVSRGENETRNEDGGGTYTSPRSPGGLPGGNDMWWLLFNHPVTSDSLQLNNKHLGRTSNDVHRQEGLLPAEGTA